MSVISNLTPNGGEIFYAFHNGTAMNTINNEIEFDITVANNVTIRYSLTGSSPWTNIATGVSTAIGTNTYDWSLSAAEYSTLLGSATTEDSMYIDIYDEVDTNDTVSAAVFTLSRVSWAAFGPNDTDNPEKIHNESLVNIRWSEAFESETENVFIEYRYKTTGSFGSWTSLVASTPNDGSYLWTPSDDAIPDEATVQLRISGASGGDHVSNIGYTEVDDTATGGFIISHDLGDAPSGSGNQKLPERKDIHARASIEKGIYADEAFAVGQFEAGEGIVIEQRDEDGLDWSGNDRSGGTSDDPYAAWNIIIKQKDFVRAPRDLHGVLDYVSGTPTADSIVAGDEYYGSTYYFDIVHSWSLGDTLDDDYITGQTINSFIFEIDQITSLGDRKKPQYDVRPTWEARDEDTIRVYCTLKGTIVDPTSGSAVDDLVTLSKDQLGFDPGTYLFEYRLKEVLA